MYREVREYTASHHVTLVAVSKTRSVDQIMALYHMGQRVFGENRVQELMDKKDLLPQDIQWHLIGHLQKNKVKYIAPFITMIHSVDSLDLLQSIDRESAKNHRVTDVLLQLFIATEETKFGLDIAETHAILEECRRTPLTHVRIRGVMGMASLTEDVAQIRHEFRSLRLSFDDLKKHYFTDIASFDQISMGMSGDYRLAIEEGSTMVRIGSALFS